MSSGLGVSIIHIENEPLFTMHTLMPNGYAFDEPDHVLWSRVIERLNSQTVPEDDGDTLVDRVRVSSWSRSDAWRETLKAHARLLGGKPFAEDGVSVFKEDTVASMSSDDYSAMSRRAAIAVFSQALFCGAKEIDLAKELEPATLVDLEQYGERHWPCLRGANTCIITREDPAAVRAEIEAQLAHVVGVAVTSVSPSNSRRLRVAWDQKPAFAVLAWRIDDSSPAAGAVLCLLEDVLGEPLDDLFRGGIRTAEYCPRLPGGPLFLLTLKPRDAGGVEEMVDTVRSDLGSLLSKKGLPATFGQTREDLAQQYLLATVPYASSELLQEHRLNVFGLHQYWRQQWSDIEYNFGAARAEVGRAIQSMTPDEFVKTARRLLSDKACITCTIVPDSKSRDARD
jgi:hypothetical protein